MINTLLGIKKGMTSTYDYRGRRTGATIIEVAPNFVTQIKTADSKDGYNAIQVAIGDKKSVKQPQIGHFKKAGLDKKFRWVREIRIHKDVENSLEGLETGQEIKASDVISAGDLVKVTGVSKGKGFQGGVRRHGFHGGPKTHGQSDRHRAPGSIGTGTTPGRVLKGKKMAGHMGVDTVSVLGLEVIKVDKANNLLVVKGGIPGANGSLIRIEKQGALKGYVAPEETEEEVTEAAIVEEANEQPVETESVKDENQTSEEAGLAENIQVDESNETTTETEPENAESSEAPVDEAPAETEAVAATEEETK